MENILKLLKRLKSIIKIIIWKIIYCKKFKTNIFNVFYPLTHIVIDGGKIIIGKNCFFNRNCSINSRKKISIGNDVIVGENVCIYDHNHRFRDKNKVIRNQGFKDNEITIGNNCWIGSNVTILAGSKIGNNVVIGAGCVVNGIIEDNTIVKCSSNFIKERY